MIWPEGRLEEWGPKDLLNRARYFYEQEPTEERRRAIQELLTQYPHAAKRRVPSKKGRYCHTEEDAFFCDGYSVAVVPHMRYCATDWHSHDFYELIYVYSGSCRHALKGLPMVMKQGDFCILPPNQVHSISSYSDEDRIINILIRKSTFHQTFQSLLKDFGLLSTFFSHTLFQKENSAHLLFQCGEDTAIRESIAKMYEEYMSRTPFSNTILVGLLMQLLGELMRAHQLDAIQLAGRGSSRPARVSTMLQYVEDHLSTVTLQELAQQFNYSTTRCSTIIKESTGKNFSNVLREYRAHRAARLLLESDYSMMQIAEEVGFCDSSHLHKVFSTLYGVTPAQYRKEHHS